MGESAPVTVSTMASQGPGQFGASWRIRADSWSLVRLLLGNVEASLQEVACTASPEFIQSHFILPAAAERP